MQDREKLEIPVLGGIVNIEVTRLAVQNAHMKIFQTIFVFVIQNFGVWSITKALLE